MTKINLLSFLAVATLASSSALAGSHSCCSTAANGNSKEACMATFAKLDLTAAQKSKMETLADECVKSGCSKESMTKMEAGAKNVLSKAQFAAWKTNCSALSKES